MNNIFARRNKDEKNYAEPHLSFANTHLHVKRQLEPGWIPGFSDLYQECDITSEFVNESNDEETLATYNEAMRKLDADFKPLESRLLKTSWKDVSAAKQKEFRQKALEGCRVVCKVVAPHADDELFETICKPLDPSQSDVTPELEVLMVAYRDAPSRNVKTQILSLYAFRFSSDKLIEYHEPYEHIPAGR